MATNILQPFHNTDFHFVNAETEHYLAKDYYSAMKENLQKILSNIYSAELFGKETETLYNMVNDFHYLFGLLMIIYIERVNDARVNLLIDDGCGVDQGTQYYIDKYNLDCIQKHFSCMGQGYDIQEALDVFGLNPDLQGLDGIGYMMIGGSSNPLCETGKRIFKVR
jgi:hypothetical protein